MASLKARGAKEAAKHILDRRQGMIKVNVILKNEYIIHTIQGRRLILKMVKDSRIIICFLEDISKTNVSYVAYDDLKCIHLG